MSRGILQVLSARMWFNSSPQIEFISKKFLLFLGNPAGDLETSSMMIAHAAVEYVGRSSLIFLATANVDSSTYVH
jgi:hypothetical protein